MDSQEAAGRYRFSKAPGAPHIPLLFLMSPGTQPETTHVPMSLVPIQPLVPCTWHLLGDRLWTSRAPVSGDMLESPRGFVGQKEELTVSSY